MNSGPAQLLAALPWRLQAAHQFRGPQRAGAVKGTTTIHYPLLTFTASGFFLKIFDKFVPLCFLSLFSFVVVVFLRAYTL